MVWAHRMAPMLGPPSEPDEASVTSPNGARGSVVLGTADQAARQPAMSCRMLQP
jgi:hypothetical protein